MSTKEEFDHEKGRFRCCCNDEICKEACPDKPCISRRPPQLPCEECFCNGPCVSGCEKRIINDIPPNEAVLSSEVKGPLRSLEHTPRKQPIADHCPCKKTCPSTCKFKRAQIAADENEAMRSKANELQSTSLPAETSAKTAPRIGLCNCKNPCPKTCTNKKPTSEALKITISEDKESDKLRAAATAAAARNNSNTSSLRPNKQSASEISGAGVAGISFKASSDENLELPKVAREKKNVKEEEVLMSCLNKKVCVPSNYPSETRTLPRATQYQNDTNDGLTNHICNPCKCLGGTCTPACNANSRKEQTLPKTLKKTVCQPCNCGIGACTVVCRDLNKKETIITDDLNRTPCDPCNCPEFNCNPICEKQREMSAQKSKSKSKHNILEPCTKCDCDGPCNPACKELKSKTNPEKSCGVQYERLLGLRGGHPSTRLKEPENPTSEKIVAILKKLKTAAEKLDYHKTNYEDIHQRANMKTINVTCDMKENHVNTIDVFHLRSDNKPKDPISLKSQPNLIGYTFIDDFSTNVFKELRKQNEKIKNVFKNSNIENKKCVQFEKEHDNLIPQKLLEVPNQTNSISPYQEKKVVGQAFPINISEISTSKNKAIMQPSPGSNQSSSFAFKESKPKKSKASEQIIRERILCKKCNCRSQGIKLKNDGQLFVRKIVLVKKKSEPLLFQEEPLGIDNSKAGNSFKTTVITPRKEHLGLPNLSTSTSKHGISKNLTLPEIANLKDSESNKNSVSAMRPNIKSVEFAGNVESNINKNKPTTPKRTKTPTTSRKSKPINNVGSMNESASKAPSHFKHTDPKASPDPQRLTQHADKITSIKNPKLIRDKTRSTNRDAPAKVFQTVKRRVQHVPISANKLKMKPARKSEPGKMTKGEKSSNATEGNHKEPTVNKEVNAVDCCQRSPQALQVNVMNWCIEPAATKNEATESTSVKCLYCSDLSKKRKETLETLVTSEKFYAKRTVVDALLIPNEGNRVVKRTNTDQYNLKETNSKKDAMIKNKGSTSALSKVLKHKKLPSYLALARQANLLSCCELVTCKRRSSFSDIFKCAEPKICECETKKLGSELSLYSGSASCNPCISKGSLTSWCP